MCQSLIRIFHSGVLQRRLSWTFSRFIFFFFSSRRRHTILVSDWSSDVCSSDLRLTLPVPFLESVAPSVVEFRVHPSVVEMEPEVSISESSIYMDSFDYGYSSNYGYMDNIKEFESEDFMTASEKEVGYQYQCCDQLKAGLQMSHSSGSESEPERLDS